MKQFEIFSTKRRFFVKTQRHSTHGKINIILPTEPAAENQSIEGEGVRGEIKMPYRPLAAWSAIYHSQINMNVVSAKCNLSDP